MTETISIGTEGLSNTIDMVRYAHWNADAALGEGTSMALATFLGMSQGFPGIPGWMACLWDFCMPPPIIYNI